MSEDPIGSVEQLAQGDRNVLDRLYPPDLSRFHDRSTLVVDADGRILRAFTSGDDRWRLLAGPQDVDPLFLKLLLAYEDRRFRWHPGVDPLSVLRAMGQFIAHGEIVSGASTLTMQTARLLEPHSRDLAEPELRGSARRVRARALGPIGTPRERRRRPRHRRGRRRVA